MPTGVNFLQFRKNNVDMENKMDGIKLTLNTSHVWLLLSLIVWMVGIGGSDLYALPAVVGIILLFREIIINDCPIPYFLT